MHRSFKLASQVSRTITGEPALSHWGFAVQAIMALIVIVLLTLTFAALEVFVLGDESLSALEAAMAIRSIDSISIRHPLPWPSPIQETAQ